MLRAFCVGGVHLFPRILLALRAVAIVRGMRCYLGRIFELDDPLIDHARRPEEDVLSIDGCDAVPCLSLVKKFK